MYILYILSASRRMDMLFFCIHVNTDGTAWCSTALLLWCMTFVGWFVLANRWLSLVQRLCEMYLSYYVCWHGCLPVCLAAVLCLSVGPCVSVYPLMFTLGLVLEGCMRTNLPYSPTIHPIFLCVDFSHLNSLLSILSPSSLTWNYSSKSAA